MKPVIIIPSILFTLLIFFNLTSCKKESLPIELAVVEISDIIVITDTSFVCTSKILNDGNDEIIEKGVCWSTLNRPVIANNRTVDGKGSDDYQSTINGLIQTGVYYVRSYATNSVGTSYGEVMKFQTMEGDGKQVIDYDGNIYNTVQIGDQTWLRENCYAVHYQNGDNVYQTKKNTLFEDLYMNDTTSPVYYNIKSTSYYGETFTWHKLIDSRNICPTGWHPADNSDWLKLINTLGGYDIAGAKMKEVGEEHWHKPNVGATNESGFTALPGGYNNSIRVGLYAFWWSGGEEYDSTNALGWFLKYDETAAYNFYADKNVGMTVRCIKNQD